MVDENELRKQYNYQATSNLVLEQDRRGKRNRGKETDGVGQINTKDLQGRMGDLAHRSGQKDPQLQERLEKRRKRRSEKSVQPKSISLDPVGNENVVDVADELELGADGIAYAPTTRLTQQAFEQILAFVLSKLGDQPRDVLRSAAEEVVSFLKDEHITEITKKEEISQTLEATVSSDEFARVTLVAKQITDFSENRIQRSDVDDELDDKRSKYDVYEVPVVPSDDEDKGSDSQNSESSDDDFDMDIDPEKILGPTKDTLLISDKPLNEDDKQNDDDEFGNEEHKDKNSHQEQNEDFNPLEVDDYWVEKQLERYYPDSTECKTVAKKVSDILLTTQNERTCENELAMTLGFDKLDFITSILEHRDEITFRLKFVLAKDEKHRQEILSAAKVSESRPEMLNLVRLMEKSALVTESDVKEEETNGKKVKKRNRRKSVHFEDEEMPDVDEEKGSKFSLRRLDLENLAFQKGGRLMTTREFKLPEGNEHLEYKEYEEWHIPPTRAKTNPNDGGLVHISSLPSWAQRAFPNTSRLNRMQTTVYPTAFESDENMLVCAPTGAGKTNVAVLTILREIRNSMPANKDDLDIGDADLSSFKAVYVAPMKALVAEVVENLGRRMKHLGITVSELTGDVSLSSQQITDTQVIVTTPEKWDIITRKSGQRLFTSLVRLLIIDEIHLLHNERGPVLETIVARTLRNVESMTALTRVVGLSATLPNYLEVAAFLRVDVDSGLFHFDLSHRPVPLQQTYIGISSRKALKRFQLMNELTYEKIKVQLQSSNQLIVFVHGRKETTNTCKYIIEKAVDDEFIDSFLRPGTASFEVVQSELPGVNGKDLRALLERGLATHHAGMTRKDRELVEALFAEGHVKVLVSTATLAWGVNLPADTVIIKGTQIYSPELGRWTELSMMDVMQMMGRAGRPQFAKHGEGIVITTKADVLFYLSILNNQLPIESQFVSRIVDMVNAEVAMGSISSVKDGALWLCYTYLYVRMIKDPTIYGIPVEEHHLDPKLERRRQELIHTAALELMSSGLVKYNRRTGTMESTGLGRVAADFYISNQSMYIYLQHMKPTTLDIDLLRIFSLSSEFRNIRVREEERLELSRLAERVPIPIKDSLDEPTAKVNILLQAYISNMPLEGLALRSDMVYISQSGARLTRALLHVAIQTNNAALFSRCLRLCKAVSARQWVSQTPLRQFKGIIGKEVLYKIERKDLAFERYLDFKEAELGELLRSERLGRTVHRLVHSLPLLHVDYHVKPLTRSRIEIELILSSDFNYDSKIHGPGEAFWLTIEDTDGELLLHSELFYLRRSLANEEHRITVTVPLTKPMPPHYYVRCISDQWIAKEFFIPISFTKLTLPEKHAPLTKLVSRRLLSVRGAFKDSENAEDEDESLNILAFREALSVVTGYFADLLSSFTPLQAEVFPTLFESDENAILATLPGLERRVCGELCLARLFCRDPTALAVWVVGRGETAVNSIYNTLKNGLGKHLSLRVFKFLGESSEAYSNLKMAGSVVITTPQKWDMFSRRWRRTREGKILARVRLVVLDGIHHVAAKGDNGVALEVLTSRMRNISVDSQESGRPSTRIVGLSDPIANAHDIGQWLGASSSSVFSYHPSEIDRNLKVLVSSSGFRTVRTNSHAQQLARPVFRVIRQQTKYSSDGTVVFVPSRKLCRHLALEMCELSTQGGDSRRFLGQISNDIETRIKGVKTNTLRECISAGVGFTYDTLPAEDQALVEELFLTRVIQVVIVPSNFSWQGSSLNPRLVVIGGTSQEPNGGLANRRSEYDPSDILRMICVSRLSRLNDEKCTAVIITEPALHEHYKSQSMEPIPVESNLPSRLSDHLNAEIASRFIETKQEAVNYLTWTFFYHRLPKNPNYYGLKGLSHNDMSNYLSELVETSLSYLEGSKCVATEGEDDTALGTLNLGIIASHYYMRHETVERFMSSLTQKTRLRGLLDILSISAEFDNVPVRVGDEEILRRLAENLPFKLEENDQVVSYSDPHVKTHLLLQAHMTRAAVPPEFVDDEKSILATALRLLRAGVDIIASAGWLKPALTAIELSQMMVQSVWDLDYPMAQLPHLSPAIARTLADEYDVKDVFEFLEMDSADRSKVLKHLSNNQILELSTACQQFPNVELEIQSVSEFEDEDGSKLGRVTIVVARCDEDSEDEEPVSKPTEKVPLIVAPRYPEQKEEGWWLIIGDTETNSLLTVKYVTLKQHTTVKLDFTPPSKPGKCQLQLHLLSDSYVDCDQTKEFFISINSNIDDKDDEDSSDEDSRMED